MSVVSCRMVLVVTSSMAQAAANGAVRYDYVRRPVKVTENRASANHVLGLEAASAFDGFGAQGAAPAAARAWFQKAVPTPDAPLSCEIDYGAPVAVSALAHYFYTPGSRDMRYSCPAPAAFRKVRISARTKAGDWSEAALLDGLSPECPQVLPVRGAKPARYWRIEVLEMAPMAEFVSSYEIETYTGGIPSIKAVPTGKDFAAEFARRVREHQPSTKPLAAISLSGGGDALDLSVGEGNRAVNGKLAIDAGGKPSRLVGAGEGAWRAKCGRGEVRAISRMTPMGALIELSFKPAEGCPLQYERASLRLTAPEPTLYYIPAYAWSRKAVDVTVRTATLQTRMCVLGVREANLCVCPGSDRGEVGFTKGSIFCNLLIGREPVPVLIAAVPGDWWSAYQFAVQDIYGFREPAQTVPVSEIQYGISRYLMRDDVWEPTLGTVKSWPQRDPHTKMVGFDCFQLYGVPYSIPAYWARWRMTGDKQALERCRSIALWMCRSGVRVHDGPARGAFYTLQRFRPGTTPAMDARGSTQGWGLSTLTSQSTGSALWSLLYYRRTTGDQDPEIGKCIREAADWLLKTQTPEGGWPYGHDPAGKAVDALPSSGAIWNIWALWRLGRETGDPKFSEAAKRATAWYARAFVDPHHYHGYWEDVGPNCREGYEAGIAAVVFGEMGEDDLAVQAARDAMQWVYTRQIENREPDNSAGLVAEQTGWPPASYCNPMMALAAHTAWRITGDPFWKPFAMIPKAIGWWYQPESGAMVWIVDSTQTAPVVGPAFESWWNDWCIAQVGSLTLRWLVREVNRRGGGAAEIDEETLTGQLLGRQVRAWAPQGGLRPVPPEHGQVNWLGFQSEDSLFVAFMNDGDAGVAVCPLQGRDVLNGAASWPERLHRISEGKAVSRTWSGGPITLGRGEMAVAEWRVRR